MEQKASKVAERAERKRKISERGGK